MSNPGGYPRVNRSQNGEIWKQPKPIGLKVETPVPGSYESGNAQHDKWEYAVQHTNSAARLPRSRVVVTVERACGHSESATIEWQNDHFESSNPEITDKMGSKDEVLRLTKAVQDATRSVVQSVRDQQEARAR